MSMPGKATILVVDDDGMLRDLIVDALDDLGYTVLKAHDGPSALDVLQGTGKIDVVFSDVSMPNGMSGVELATHARQLRPELHIILASGFAKGQIGDFPEDVVFLPKPYRVRQLLEIIDTQTAGRAQ
jgi:CheY-like chemotaxis protein